MSVIRCKFSGGKNVEIFLVKFFFLIFFCNFFLNFVFNINFFFL